MNTLPTCDSAVPAPVANPQNPPRTDAIEKLIPNADTEISAVQHVPVASHEMFNMETAYDFINSIQSAFQVHELNSVLEFIHAYFVSTPPPKSISKSALEQGLVYGYPVFIDGEHTDDFLTRLIDSAVLEKKDEHVDDIFFNTTLTSCAKFVCEHLLNAEINQSTFIGNDKPQ